MIEPPLEGEQFSSDRRINCDFFLCSLASRAHNYDLWHIVAQTNHWTYTLQKYNEDNYTIDPYDAIYGLRRALAIRLHNDPIPDTRADVFQLYHFHHIIRATSIQNFPKNHPEGMACTADTKVFLMSDGLMATATGADGNYDAENW